MPPTLPHYHVLMLSSLPTPGDRVRFLWRRLSGLPGGKRLFSSLFGRMGPYTGSIGARVETLEPGFCRVTLRDRHGVRHHLNSIHAMTLANLAEAASGLVVEYRVERHAAKLGDRLSRAFAIAAANKVGRKVVREDVTRCRTPRVVSSAG